MAFTFKSDTRLIAAMAFTLAVILCLLSLASVTPELHGQDPNSLDLLTYFKKPIAVAVDSNGYVFVADAETHRVLKFTDDGKMIQGWGGKGSGNGQFNIPNGIAIDSSNNVYVTDGQNHRVQKFSNTGSYLNQWGNYCEIQTNTNCVDADGPNGPLSKGDGEFFYPHGISLDIYNTVYVVDSANSRIQKFTIEGKFLGKWGTLGSGNGQFMFPTDITIDSSGYAYVADYGNHRIQKFIPTVVVPSKPTLHGVFITKWANPGLFNYPVGIDHDSLNYVYVTDSGHHRVIKFTHDGLVNDNWGDNDPGSGNGEFNKPYGIALNPQGTSVYVADSENDRIQKFQLADPCPQGTTQVGTKVCFVTKWGPKHNIINIP